MRWCVRLGCAGQGTRGRPLVTPLRRSVRARACEVCAGSGALTLPVPSRGIGRARAAARRRAASPSAPSSPWWAAAALPLALPLPFPARRQPARLGAQARLGALPWAGRAGIVHCTVILAVAGAVAVLAPQIPACDAAICTAFAASPCHKLSGCVPDFRPSNEEADSQVYRPPSGRSAECAPGSQRTTFLVIGYFVSPLASDHDAAFYLARRSIY